MKHIILIIINVIFYQQLHAQSKGYYYKGNFIELTEDSNNIVLFFKPDFFFLNDSSTFISDTNIVAMDVSDGTEDVLFARITYRVKIENISNYLHAKYHGVDTALHDFSYGYKSFENKFLYPTPELIFRLKEGVHLYDLTSFINTNHANLISEKYGVYRYRIDKIDSSFIISKRFVELNIVEWAEPNFYGEIKITDPNYADQFYLNNTAQSIDGITGVSDIDIDADKAWSHGFMGNNTVRVAIIDDGVDPHEDLEDANNNTKVTSGFVPDCITNCSGGCAGNNFHGMACAGIVAATPNNLGIKGVAPDVIIIPIRIIKANGGSKSNGGIAEAIGKAWDDRGADILSNSWGLVSESNAVTDAIDIALDQGRNGLGAIVVFASGNNGLSNPFYPGSLQEVISVGAVNLNDNLFNYSGGGANLDVVAPSGLTNLT